MTITDTLFRGTAEYNQQFHKICQPIVDFLSLTGVAFIDIKHGVQLTNLHTNVKWMERCMEQHYYMNDPCMVSPDNVVGGFAFSASYQDTSYKDGMLKDAEENFDLCSNFSYIEKGKNSFQAFGFATSANNHAFIDKVFSNFRIIKRFIRYIQHELSIKQAEIDKYTFDFASLKGNLFYQQPGILMADPEMSLKQLQALKSLGIEQPLNTLTVSEQERKCLRLCLDGKTAKESAEILHLAHTTVVSYLENLKSKFGCCDKKDIIRVAEVLEGLGRI
jgi:DNA-binding CsgD family transcriptional regulator